MPFPNINYHAPVPDTGHDAQLPKGPRGMITLLTRLGFLQQEEMQGINNMINLKEDILIRVNAYQEGDDLSRIFHRIQVWGGMGGRSIYVRNNGFVAENVLPFYHDLVNGCFPIQDITQNSLENVRDQIHLFNANVHNIGLSFITKHVYFWLHRNLGENAFPIYDSVLARGIMEQPVVREIDLVPYWQAMIGKAQMENISIESLESHLFAYYRPF